MDCAGRNGQGANCKAAHCGRWAEKSLAIARALIVENLTLSDVAEQFDCSTAYANTIRARFYTKAQEVRLQAFKQQMKPDELAAIKPYSKDVLELSNDGFTTAQIVEYLEQNNVTVSADSVRKYLGAEA